MNIYTIEWPVRNRHLLTAVVIAKDKYQAIELADIRSEVLSIKMIGVCTDETVEAHVVAEESYE